MSMTLLSLHSLLWFAGAGALTGLLSGMLGIGGGIVMVPFLAWILPKEGIPLTMQMHVAIATSLAVVFVTSLSSVRSHSKRGGVAWPILLPLLPGVALGAILGTLVAGRMSNMMLILIFASFASLVGLRLLFQVHAKGRWKAPPDRMWALIGVVLGMLTALLGTGGGIFMVPLLLAFNFSVREAIGTSLLAVIPLAASGVIGYSLVGSMSPMPPGSTGYVFWPAVLFIAPAGLLAAPLGTRLAYRLPTHLLTRLFAGFILVMAISMFYKSGVF